MVLTAAAADKFDANSKSHIFTVTDTKLYVPVVTLSAKDNQKLKMTILQDYSKILFIKKHNQKL